MAKDRGKPGTVEIRCHPSRAVYSESFTRCPLVINMNAQWELGKALKYNRVQCPGEYGPDSKENREKWFQQCLDEITKLDKRDKPSSITFPHEIGSGLAGGHWPKCEAMIERFAEANPEVEVTIVFWGNGGPKCLEEYGSDPPKRKKQEELVAEQEEVAEELFGERFHEKLNEHFTEECRQRNVLERLRQRKLMS